MPIKLRGSTSGDITLTAAAVAGTNTLTVPAATGTLLTTVSTNVVNQAMLTSGVAGNGPAFSANSIGTQTFSSGTPERVSLTTELYDTNSCFASSRFTPTVAGYYSISGTFGFSSSTNLAQYATCYLEKNGSSAYLNFGGEVSAGTTAFASTSGLIYCNGTTDYIELWGRATGSGTLTSSTYSSLSGFLARSAT